MASVVVPTMSSFPTKFNVRMPYLEARKAAAPFGGLLSHDFLDRCLVGTSARRDLIDAIRSDIDHYFVLVNEIVACPERGGVFKRGQDIVDTRFGWAVPASVVPVEALDRRYIALYITPGTEIEERSGKGILSNPKSIEVVSELVEPFVMGQEGHGKIDEKTCLPRMITAEELKALPEDQVRILFGNKTVMVRPIRRSYCCECDGGRYISLYNPSFPATVVAMGEQIQTAQQ